MRQSEVLSLMRENVAYKLQHGKAKEAVDMLEKLHKYVKFLVFYTEEGCSACASYELSLFTQRCRAHCQFFYLELLSLTMLWRRGGLTVSALASGSNGRCSSPDWGHYVVFLGKTLYSHSASVHPGV